MEGLWVIDLVSRSIAGGAYCYNVMEGIVYVWYLSAKIVRKKNWQNNLFISIRQILLVVTIKVNQLHIPGCW